MDNLKNVSDKELFWYVVVCFFVYWYFKKINIIFAFVITIFVFRFFVQSSDNINNKKLELFEQKKNYIRPKSKIIEKYPQL
jgi:prolipoprotein diacylglyceryltransferase